MALSVSRGRELITEFCAIYPGACQIQYRVRATQEDAFHKDATTERIGRVLGAYLPASRIAAFATSNIRDENEFRRTARHEILGHFGINTFTSENKRKLLVALSKARDQSGLSALYEKADKFYSHKSELEKAEEVFSFVCEGISPRRYIDKLKGQHTFHEVVLERTRTMQFHDIRNIASMVAQGLQDRTRSLQIIPATDREQFRSAARHAGFKHLDAGRAQTPAAAMQDPDFTEGQSLDDRIRAIKAEAKRQARARQNQQNGRATDGSERNREQKGGPDQDRSR